MTENEALLRRIEERDGSALRVVYEQYKDHLLTVATCLLLDHALAEDVLHDTFVRFAGEASRLRVRGSLKSYLATCVANRARDELRRQSHRLTSLEQMEGIVSTGAGPLQAAMDCEENERLQAALAELPYEQREAIVLHLHADMAFREVAGAQGVSINTVQSRYRYGIDKLRSFLDAGVRT